MMQREIGEPSFPLWLIGDSNPIQWEDRLITPLDPRHPVRHNIWTAVLDVIQDRVYREARARIDTSKIYIRNAVDDPGKKPRASAEKWDADTEEERQRLESLLGKYQPSLVLCFGAFAFEFARRARCEMPLHKFSYWGAEELGCDFSKRMDAFDPRQVSIIPLLHRVISGGKYLQAHKAFCNWAEANYFQFVGNRLADVLLRYSQQLPVWIE